MARRWATAGGPTAAICSQCPNGEDPDGQDFAGPTHKEIQAQSAPSTGRVDSSGTLTIQRKTDHSPAEKNIPACNLGVFSPTIPMFLRRTLAKACAIARDIKFDNNPLKPTTPVRNYCCLWIVASCFGCLEGKSGEEKGRSHEMPRGTT